MAGETGKWTVITSHRLLFAALSIIVKFARYHVRGRVFLEKQKLKGTMEKVLRKTLQRKCLGR